MPGRSKRPTEKVSGIIYLTDSTVAAGQDTYEMLPNTDLVVAATAKNFRWDLQIGKMNGNTVTVDKSRKIAMAILRVPNGTAIPTLSLTSNLMNGQVVAVSEHMIAYKAFRMSYLDAVSDTDDGEYYHWKGKTTVARKLKPGDKLTLVIGYEAVAATGTSLIVSGSIQYFLLY